MKRTLFVIVVTFLMCSFTHAEELKWYSWNEGYELARKEKKPMLIFVQASWCHQCKRLNDKTFNNEEIIPLIAQDFIPVKFDIEAEEEYLFGDTKVSGLDLLTAISSESIMGIPTTIFWIADAKKVKPVAGLKDPDEMKELLAANREKQ
nr:thioredoxin family protein [Bacteroidota bacterium]